MIPKFILTLAALLLACAGVFAAGAAANKTVSLPKPIEADSPCPAVGCASGSCHDYASVPEPDGNTQLACPETSCSSQECHAWETLANAYRQPSDMSLNLWILMPVVLVLGLVIVLKKL